MVPVPTVLEREQIHVGERRLLEHLDAYSAPRLVEYFDPDPCTPIYPMSKAAGAPAMDMASRSVAEKKREEALGVRIEARYSVGEYDILILGAKQSEGLETWLRENGYRIPAKAAAALQPYIRQDMKFFVAKVNLEAQKASGVQYLRPLQIAYESKKFMLPIRLGMANAAGPQDLIVYALTRRGRVESTNYRTTRIPADLNVPVFVKSDFGKFYQDAFARSVDKEDRRAVFTEYVWDMGWCDPVRGAAAEPRGAAAAGRVLARSRSVGFARARVPPWTGGRAGERAPHPAARALRRRALPGGPGVPGDLRPEQLPGAVHPPAPVQGRRRVQRDGRLPRAAERPADEGGGDPRLAHRLVDAGHPPEDGPGRLGREEPAPVVPQALERVSRPPAQLRP